MQSIVRNAIARIDVMQQGRCISRGTGFLVADGLVLTALHVVADRAQPSLATYPGEIVLTFPAGSATATIHEAYWDRLADWVLLRFETPAGCNGSLRPLPLAELREDGATWETYGFPDANPRDGMVNIGEVSNCLGTLEGNPVYQLFSREAAAGQGEPVKGLSGGPVIVRDAVVGHLRFALMRDNQTVAGTVYACPIASVLAKTGNLLPLPDPCFGLPGLPRLPLPAAPFRNLAWFREGEAEVFFGRQRDIRQMYQRLTVEDGAPILLLYGQAGVGKSSFLDAGLLPRLRWYHQVCYLRRDPQNSLVQTLRAGLALLGGTDNSAPSCVDAWLAVEQNSGKPLVVFFDQMEEVYSHPSLEFPNEVEEFTRELGRLFAAGMARGRLVLSFRKEWLSEIQKQMEDNRLAYAKIFLEGLDRAGVIEAATGLMQTTRLQEFYGLKVQPGTAEQIADDLLSDPDSPIAPTLQILLTKMWGKATAESRSAPAMTLDLYQSLKKEGVLLGDFLDQQLDALQAAHAEWVESGLALDVLTYHITPLGTAKECPLEELLATYRHRASDIPSLIQELIGLFLLSDTSRDDGRNATRLCHDTLAPLVRQRYARSEHLGQRARRIIENRVDDWVEGSETGLLDEGSLAAVERGAAGMRLRTVKEDKLVEASRVLQRRRSRDRAARRIGVALGAAAIVAAAVVATLQWYRAAAAEQFAQVQAKVAGTMQTIANSNYVAADGERKLANTQEARAIDEQKVAAMRLALSDGLRLIQIQPAQALLSAIAAVARSRKLNSVDVQAQAILYRAMDEVREANVFPAELDALPSVTWGTGGRLAVFGIDSSPAHRGFRIGLYDESGRMLPASIDLGREIPILDSEGTMDDAVLKWSPDGKLLAVGGTAQGIIRVWDQNGQLVTDRLSTQGYPTLAFLPDPKNPVLVARSEMKLSAWNSSWKLLWEVPGAVAEKGSIVSIAAGRSAAHNNQMVIVTGAANGDLAMWSKDGKPILTLPVGATSDYVITALDMATGPAGTIIAVKKADDTVQVWSDKPATKPLVESRFQNQYVCGLKLSPRGDLLAIQLSIGSIHFENPATGYDVLPVFQGPVPRKACPTLAFDGTGDRLAVQDGESEIHIMDLSGRPLLQTFDTGQDNVWDSLSRLRFSPDSVYLAAAVGRHVYLWDTRTGAERDLNFVGTDSAGGSLFSPRLAFSPDSKRLAGGGQDGLLSIWQSSGELIRTISLGKRIREVGFNRDGTGVLVETEEGNQQIRTVESVGVQTNVVTPLWTPGSRKGAPEKIERVGFSVDGARIATASKADAGDTIQVWNVDGSPAAPSFRATGIHLADQVKDKSMADIPVLGFSQDGQTVIVLDGDTATFWTLDGRRLPPDSAVENFNDWPALAPDGSMVFRAGDGVGVFDRLTGVKVAEFGTNSDSFNGGSVVGVAVSPDGTRVAGLQAKGKVRIWRAGWRQWLGPACDRIRHHPILNVAGVSDPFQLENIQYAKDICGELVWSREK